MADEGETEPGGGEPPAEAQSRKYDQAFFLALAAKGKDAWNAWRRNPANKDVHVTFAGTDFSEAPRDAINFEGFEFGKDALMFGANWRGIESEDILEQHKIFKPGRACFIGTIFGHGASFEGAFFGDGTIFEGATFGDEASFMGANFGDFTYFTDAVFDNEASFQCTTFGDFTNFVGAAFGDHASFTCASFGAATFFDAAAFGDWAFFTGSTFGHAVRFRNVVYYGRLDFTGSSTAQWSRDFEAATLGASADGREALKERHQESWDRFGSRPNIFLAIFFPNARFGSQVNFSGRTFEDDADFTNTRFDYPPIFDAAPKASHCDFTGSRIGFVPAGKWLHWTENSRVPVQLRAFRKIAEETKNHDLERDLYIEERKAERGVYINQLLERDELKKKLSDVTEQKRTSG